MKPGQVTRHATLEQETSAMRILMAAALAMLLSCKSAHAEEAVEIPLGQIWALDMPGTRDIREFTPIQRGPPRTQFLNIIRQSLWGKPPEDEAKNGFVVEGVDSLVSFRASALLRSRSGRWNVETHSTKAELSLVFFSHPSAYQVHLEVVERRGTEIDVRYRLVPHFTGKVTVHLALIPLGRLPVGDYQVNMIQSPMEQKYLDAGFQPLSEEQTKLTVSQSFSFAVAELPGPDPGPAEDSIVIPLEEIWGYQLEGTRDIGTLDFDQLPQPLGTLSTRPLDSADQQEAQPGFAVLGTGQEALVAAHAKLPDDKQPTDAFPAGNEISLVFFSQGRAAPFIVLERVERRDQVIDIRYRWRSDGSGGSQPFALIPLGKLPSGEYQVNMMPTLGEDIRLRPGSAGTEFVASLRRSVCQPFTFTIEGPSETDSGERGKGHAR